MSRFSSFKQYVFRNLFPDYYRDYDTYKNPEKENKGILERFVEVCSGYFDTDVVPEIDTILNNIDVDLCKELYLQYLWEMLGEIPYANKHQDVPPAPNPRVILKYALSLLKIRGSKTFFDILGKIYGFDIKMEFTTIPSRIVGVDMVADEDGKVRVKSQYNPEEKVSTYSNIYSTYPDGNCSDCKKVKITLTLSSGLLSDLAIQNGYLWNPREQRYQKPDPNDPVANVDFGLGEVMEYMAPFRRIIEKYLPINVNSADNPPEYEYDYLNSFPYYMEPIFDPDFSSKYLPITVDKTEVILAPLYSEK